MNDVPEQSPDSEEGTAASAGTSHQEFPFFRSNELLSRDDSRLLIVDVQERLLPHIPVRKRLIRQCRLLLQGASILGIPITATEQYPKGLGPTTPELTEFFPEDLRSRVPEKIRFSSAETLNWGPAGVQPDGRDKVVIAGLEAHICVQQTVADLIALGYRVAVPADAVASRHKFDWKFALRRMSDAGAIITTTEAMLFEWCEVAGSSEFSRISKLVTQQETPKSKG